MFDRIRAAWKLLYSPDALHEEMRRVIQQERQSRDNQRGFSLDSLDTLAAVTGRVIDQFGSPVGRSEQLRLVDESRGELLRLLLASRRLAAEALWRMQPPSTTPPIQCLPQDFAGLLAQMKAEFPHLYPLWERINFKETPEHFAKKPETSCTIGKRHTDEPFSGFIAPYLRGRVLDVGCGPYAVPLYLKGYPTDLIYGLDPLVPFEPHPFVFARGLAEFLPFPDASFDAVIAATSLDHALSLTKTLSEIRRVIRPGATLLVWDGFVPGSPRYDPHDPHLQPVDDFHFFHFDEGWFEEIMSEYGFAVGEKLAFDPSPHHPQYCISYFYALRATA
jgi:SAM-dependent methyltransferase